MKLLTLALVAAAPALLFADGNSDTAQATAKVHIVAPVKIVSDGALDFGQIVVDDINKASSVVMTTNTVKDGDTTATLSQWNGCAKYKNSHRPAAAQFHYSQDVQKSVGANVGITIDKIVFLKGGIGGDVALHTNSDLPADGCALFRIKDQYEIKDYVQFYHFGVGGKLEIPAGALGQKAGVLNVKVEYM